MAARDSAGLRPVPDAGPCAPWAALGDRLRQIGLTCAFQLARQDQSNAYPAAQRDDWLRHTLAADPSPAATALRLFSSDAPVATEQCQVALGPDLFAHCCQAGLLLAEGDGWLCGLQLELVNDLYLFSDRPGLGEQTVMAFGPTTQILLGASYPRQHVCSALDLGCGGGVLALLMAGNADNVVGVDINPRAIALARLNAVINNINNVTFLEGDLYAPVSGQRFNLIVSQPPFVARLADQTHVHYLHGGTRGDELFHRVLAEMPAQLATGGVGIVLADLAIDNPNEPTAAIPTSPHAQTTVLLDSQSIPLTLHATGYLANAYFLRGDALWQQVEAMVAHLRACGMQEIRPAIVLVEAAAGQSLQRFDLPAGRLRTLERPSIDQLLASARSAAQPWQAWLPLQLRIAPGTQWQQSGTFPAQEEPDSWTLLPGSESLLPNPVVGDGLLQLLQTVHESDSVATALAELVPEGQSLPEFQQSAIQALSRMVLHGILVIA